MFLDLFAGSGQIGLEALSRGAKRAVFVDSAKASCGVVLENIHTTGFENEAQVMNAEYASYLLRCTETFDIAFLDPPYRTGTLTKALLAVTPHMNRGGIVICEHPTDEELAGDGGGIRARARLPLRKNLADRVSPSKHGVSAKKGGISMRIGICPGSFRPGHAGTHGHHLPVRAKFSTKSSSRRR